ncbi:peptidoglycan-binding protein [Streptomyces sp. NPDC053069]|uniref:peptidoglycan-binding protein n=1 Tax=Streptomyces sp. NPDC053069 TaxID=3365695 RepID=UPI0037D6DFA2
MTRTNRTAGRRAGGAAAVLAAVAALAAGGATPAQAGWDGTLQACKNTYGSEHYLGWDIPTVVLARGSTGVCVQELQEELVEAGAVAVADRPGFVDGVFGPKTYGAVVNYQLRHAVTGGADGVVGRYTWHSLIAQVYFE